jgi:hypothetical protein
VGMLGCFAYRSFWEARSRGRVIPILPVATEVKPRQLRAFYSGFGGQARPERPGDSREAAIFVSIGRCSESFRQGNSRQSCHPFDHSWGGAWTI